MSITGSNNPFACNPVVFANANSIVSLGTITRDGNQFTFSVGFVWKINGVTYQNTAPVVLTIAEASEGFSRIDNALLNTLNSIELQQGLESETIALKPVAPYTNIILTSWNISGSAIEDTETPIVGNQFIEKSDFLVHNFVGSGSDVVIPLLANGASEIRLQSGLTPLTSIDGFDLSLITGNPAAKVPYNGKVFLIRNTASAPITLKNFGDADFKFYSLSGTDVVIPVNGIITVKYGFFGSESSFTEYFRNWTEPIDLSHKADLVGGKVPASQLPSYVDDVIEGYFNGTNFYTDALFTDLITPESGKIYVNIAVTPATQYRWSGSAYVQISSEFDTTINAKVFDTTEKVGLKLQNLLDEDFRRALVIQGGLTANQRRYFEYLNHLGIRTNLLGFNAQNSFIAFDAINSYHYITCHSAGASSINSYGTFQVRVNADESATGNNGMAIYDGTANPSSVSNIMYNLSSAGIYLNKGRFLQAQSPDNLQFNKFFCTNGNAYINSTLALRLYNTGNKFNFADNGLVDRFVIDVASSKVKVGIGTATPNANSIVDVVSTTQFSRPFPVMTEAQRLAIVSPQIGGHVYQSNGTEGVYVYKSSGWVFAY